MIQKDNDLDDQDDSAGMDELPMYMAVLYTQ